MFFDDIAKQLNLQHVEDWYEVATVQDTQFTSLLSKHYKNSLFQALSTIYTDHHWLPWKFEAERSQFLNNQKNRKIYFDWLGKQAKVEDVTDWYKVKMNQLEAIDPQLVR